MGLNTKGDRRERELVNALDERGWAVMRAPASGGATERDLPDVHAGHPDREHTVAIEAKSSSGDPIYLDRPEVEALCRFAALFGSEPVIGVKFDVKNGDPPWGVDDDPGWRFLAPEECHRTDDGNYRVKKQTAYERGAGLERLGRAES